MIYLFIFVLSAAVGLLAHKSESKAGGVFLSGIAVLIPSIFAGMRSSIVGTDNYYFFEPAFKLAVQSSKITNVMFHLHMDPGTEFLFYVISRFTKDYHWVLFVFSFITNLFVYLSIWKERRKVGVFMPMMIYFLFLFCPLLCYVRQSVALAICLFAFHFANEGNPWKFCFFVAIATVMHTSAFVFFVVYPLINYLYKGYSRTRIIFISLCGFVIIVFFYEISIWHRK